jgi:hypothetical protein
MLNVIMLRVIKLNVVMLSLIMLNVVMLSVIMPSVVAPVGVSLKNRFKSKEEFFQSLNEVVVLSLGLYNKTFLSVIS